MKYVRFQDLLHIFCAIFIDFRNERCENLKFWTDFRNRVIDGWSITVYNTEDVDFQKQIAQKISELKIEARLGNAGLYSEEKRPFIQKHRKFLFKRPCRYIFSTLLGPNVNNRQTDLAVAITDCR